MDKLNKKNIIILATIFSIITVFIILNSNKQNNNVDDDTKVQFEILDESVLTTDQDLNKWATENKDKKGTYFLKKPNSTYILISEGKTTKEGTGIFLKDVKGTKKVEVTYSIIESKTDNTTSKTVEEYIPYIAIRIPFEAQNVVFKEVESTI